MRYFRILICLIVVLTLTAAVKAMGTVTFSGSSLAVLEETPDKSTGLNKIFVVYDIKGVSATYTSGSNNSVKWYKYSSLGGGYADQINNIVRSGSQYTLSQVEGDMGYIIEDGTERYYFWVVNYIDHRLWLRGLNASDEQDCSMTSLHLQMEGSPIHYYTITGQLKTLSQGIELAYDTQEWSDDEERFATISVVKVLDEASENIHITPPVYADTYFHISGDKFLKQWNWLQEAESDLFHPFAVDVHTTAEQLAVSDDPDFRSNIIGGDTDGLGGSAPADITFSAECTEGVIHHEWQFAYDMDFEDLEYRFTVQEVNYVFREQGTMYVRYVGSNASGECEAFSETYTVHIGDSELKCPNAFSPGASPGVNDEWKVSFRSIVDFECWIFNRHGEEIYHFTDPLQGWDGTRRGKLVKPGVYFYVIDAMGADGKHYKLSGDINIINYRGGSSSSSSTDTDYDAGDTSGE